jgi:hypothetical protein
MLSKGKKSEVCYTIHFNNAYSWPNRHYTKYGVSFNTAAHSNIISNAAVVFFTRIVGQNKEKRKCRPFYCFRMFLSVCANFLMTTLTDCDIQLGQWGKGRAHNRVPKKNILIDARNILKVNR